jgi:hypothetical protein
MSLAETRPRGGQGADPVRSITCPNCKQVIRLDEALRQHVAADLIARREAQLRQQAEKEASEKVSAEIAKQQAKLSEQDERLEELGGLLKQQQEEEKQLRRKQRDLEDQKAAWDVERERMRNEIRAQEREQAQKNQQQLYDELIRRKVDGHQTEVHQLRQQIERMKTQAEETARRGATGSRQEEGVARQDVFAEELRSRFPDDEVTVAQRGRPGPDVTQRVRVGRHDFGVIVWECKRTAKWSPAWPGKLAGDMRAAGAGVGVIVSEVLPPGMDGSGRADDIWVCDFQSAVHLAAGLRWVLIAAAQYEAANAARSGSAAKVYDYVATGGFASRCEAISHAVETMTKTLAKEKRYYELRWREWEKHIGTVVASLYGIAGDLVGLGAEIPPPLRAELPEADTWALTGSSSAQLTK